LSEAGRARIDDGVKSYPSEYSNHFLISLFVGVLDKR
jgi:uncharacterized protein with ParB-like and HNH nuclease domain